MAKKTRKQLIEQAQALWKTVHQTALPAEQLEEGLDCDYELEGALAAVLGDCLDERQATTVVRLAELQDGVDCWELDGKEGITQTWLYDRVALLKLFDKYLQSALGKFSYIAVGDEIALCNQRKRTNAELESLIEQLTEEQDYTLRHEEEKNLNARLAKVSQELDRISKKLGADKAFKAVEAALKKIK